VPFDGSSGAHIMSRHLNDPLPDPRRLVPDLSVGFCRAVERAMAKDPARRHQDTQELGAELDAVRDAAPAAPHHVRAAAADLTVVIRETPSGAAFCPTFEPPCDETELGRIETALARAIGPLARVLVGRESRHAATRQALVEALAAHVTDGDERKRFLRACGVGDTGTTTGEGSGSQSTGTLPAVLVPEVMDAITRLLTDRIGPVARVLVKREAAGGGGIGVLVERLAAHVPDERERSEFLQAVGRLG
jgi:serine/threonine-protein kinase